MDSDPNKELIHSLSALSLDQLTVYASLRNRVKSLTFYSRVRRLLMKPNYLFVPALALCFATGCAPLTIPRNGAKLAKAADVPLTDLQFVSYCDFAGGSMRSEGLEFMSGKILVSPQSIHLLKDWPPSLFGERHVEIPFSAVDRVAYRHSRRGCQVQAYIGDRVLVIHTCRNRLTIDQEGTEHVFQTIKEHGIPVWEGERFYKQTVRIWGAPVTLP